MPNLRRFAGTIAAIVLLLAAAALIRAQTSPAFTPTRFTVTVEGAPDGPEVLLIPGAESSRSVFDAEARLLAPKYRLYRVQVNGFAGQPAGPNASGPVLPAVVEELHRYIAAGHLHPAVVGHSMGGLMTLMLAQAHPEDVRRIVVMDALPYFALAIKPDATLETMRPQVDAMRGMLQNQTPGQQAAQISQTVPMMVNNPEGRKEVAASALASDHAVYVQALYDDLTTDVRPGLASMKTPALVLYACDPTLQGPDPAVPDKLYAAAYSTMPKVTLQRIDGSRHFIMYDQPTAFDAAVQAFLKP